MGDVVTSGRKKFMTEKEGKDVIREETGKDEKRRESVVMIERVRLGVKVKVIWRKRVC